MESLLLGADVKIFWKDDHKFYEGTVAELDSRASREHRIEYRDEEWGFVLLSAEDFFLRLDPQRLNQLQAIAPSHSSSSPVADSDAPVKFKKPRLVQTTLTTVAPELELEEGEVEE
jgi:hypothetical protein